MHCCRKLTIFWNNHALLPKAYIHFVTPRHRKETLLSLVVVLVLAQQPEGFEPYLGMKDQFTLALPVGWSVYDQQEVLMGKRGKTGLPVVFSSEVIDGQAMKSGGQQALDKVLGQLTSVEIGLLESFTLDRLPAKKGMSCNGMDSKAQKQLLDLMGTDPMFGRRQTIRVKPHAEPAIIGGCQGLRVKGKGASSTGEGKVLDVFAVSDGEVLFLFKLLNLDEHYPKNLVTFEKVMSTLKMALASKGSN
jgi:hypothetical protein